jgi:hypothetical protein
MRQTHTAIHRNPWLLVTTHKQADRTGPGTTRGGTPDRQVLLGSEVNGMVLCLATGLSGVVFGFLAGFTTFRRSLMWCDPATPPP